MSFFKSPGLRELMQTVDGSAALLVWSETKEYKPTTFAQRNESFSLEKSKN